MQLVGILTANSVKDRLRDTMWLYCCFSEANMEADVNDGFQGDA